MEFKGRCLKQDKITYTHGKIVNIYTAYDISNNYNITSYSTSEYCLFEAVSLTKIYGIRLDRHGLFSHPSGGTGRNKIFFGVDMSSSTKIGKRKKDILIIDKDPTQGVEHTLSAEKMYSINFTENNKTFCFSFHYNGANSYLFVNSREFYKFKVKDAEIVATPLCLENISTDWVVDNLKKTGLNKYVYDFSGDYDAIAVYDMSDIHKYLMKKNNMI